MLCCILSAVVVAQNARSVRGLVYDGNGVPMAEVKLTAVGFGNSVLSGTDGTFEIMVSPYAKYIEASKDGYLPVQVEIDGSYLIVRLKIDKKYAENKAKAEEEARLAAQKAQEAEQARIAAEKAAVEKAEQERKAAEERRRIEEERRIAAEKAAAEKAEKERLAAEAKAKAEEEKRIAAEKAAAEKAEAAKRAAEEKARLAEEKRIAAEKAAAEKAEKERLAAEAKAKAEEEKARLAEQQRLAQEKAQAEAKAIEIEKAEMAKQARLEQERINELEQRAMLEQKRQREAELLREKEQKAEVRKAHIEKWRQASLKGYRSMVEFAFMMDFDLMPSYNLHYIGGYQINNCLYVGVGTGVCLHESAFGDNSVAEWSKEPQDRPLPLQTVNVPVFVYFRANFVNRRCSPYFAVAAGYRFSTKHYFQMPWQQHDYYNTSGLLINPQLGINLRMSKRSDIYLAAGFNMQQMPVFDAKGSTMFVAKFGKELYYGFDLRLGFTF